MSASLPGVSEAQRRHLLELVEIAERGGGHAAWGPSNSGEWAVARALARRGYLIHNPSRGHPPYTLSRQGLEAGRTLR